MTVTELATCSPGVAMDVGLTARLGPFRAADELATAGACVEGGAGRGVLTVIPGNSMAGETEIWADAVEEQIAVTAKPDIPEMANVRKDAGCAEAVKRERMKNIGTGRKSGTSPRTRVSPVQNELVWLLSAPPGRHARV